MARLASRLPDPVDLTQLERLTGFPFVTIFVPTTKHTSMHKQLNTPSPIDAIDQLIEARNRGDIETAIRLYESSATIVARPDVIMSGTDAVRSSLARFASLRPTFESTAHKIVEAGDLAFYCSQWSLRGTDPAGNPVQLGGRTADVLRRQPDGNWLIVLDNPWGTGILGSA
jgi:ketosteroid isomerase-like protein